MPGACEKRGIEGGPRGFVSVHSAGVKVVYFETVSQVFILSDLRRLSARHAQVDLSRNRDFRVRKNAADGRTWFCTREE
jgi:hypothetical protein